MIKVRQNLRNFRKGLAIAICLTGSATMFAQETGVVINGVMWATRNVDVFGTFAATPESSGMFYQWNRPTAWATTGTVSGWDNTIPTGTTWEAENDPSPNGWRVPTSTEIQSLLNTTYVTNVWTTSNGTKGYRFTDNTTGNSIFLPAAGYRYDNNGTGGAGTYGGYWSSTEQTSPDLGVAYYLTFNSGYAFLDGDGNNSTAFPIRCVKNSNTAINTISADTENAVVTGYFDIMGRKLNEEPTTGLYVIRYVNGTSKKVMK